MTLANNTPYSAEAIPWFATDGREVVLVVVKATFVRVETKDGRVVTVRPTVDTLLCEPAKEHIELCARAVLPMGRGKTLLAEVQVDA